MMIETRFDPEYCEEGEIAIYSSGTFGTEDKEVLVVVENTPRNFSKALKAIAKAIERASPDEDKVGPTYE